MWIIDWVRSFFVKTTPGHKFHWQPDVPDIRDYDFVATAAPVVNLVDLRPQCPPVYDQANIGSCVGNESAFLEQFVRIKLKLSEQFTPSRLFIYYNARLKDGTVTRDAGTTIRNGIKVMATYGVCPEDQPKDKANWPYIPFKFKVKPPAACYTEALTHQTLQYFRLNNLNDLLTCLTEGYPFGIGISIYESFESAAVAKTGIVPLPQKGERLIGGHAIAVVGFDREKQLFICRNSWGTGWGDKGYFYLPFSYLTNSNLAADAWTIRVAE